MNSTLHVGIGKCYKVFTFQGISGKGPIPQGLQQILMTSFCFGAKEPQRDFGLDPGSWNKNLFFISGQGPIPQGLQQILMTQFFSGAKEPQRDFGLDPGSWNKNVFFHFRAGDSTESSADFS